MLNRSSILSRPTNMKSWILKDLEGLETKEEKLLELTRKVQISKNKIREYTDRLQDEIEAYKEILGLK